MPQVTKISPQKKPGRFNIFLEGKYEFSLSEEVLLAAGLRQGDELDDVRITKLLDDDLQSKVLSKILDFISYQLRSEREVRERLDKYLIKLIADQSQREILKEKIFERVQDLGLISDEEYAKSYISGKLLSSNPPGKFKLKQFLFKKGISGKVIDSVLESYESPKELESAMSAADKHPKPTKDKLWRFLASRGYSSDVIKAVVDTKFGMN